MTTATLTPDMSLAAIREALAGVGHVCEFHTGRIEVRPRPVITPIYGNRHPHPRDVLSRSCNTLAEAESAMFHLSQHRRFP